mgnify:CR=1 FL=1
MNIVIIDDDIFVSGALKTILEASGKVTVAASGTDGKEAAELYKIHQPDVLLMDIRMKEMSGLEAAEKLGLDPQQVFKTLLASSEKGELLVAVVRDRPAGTGR